MTKIDSLDKLLDIKESRHELTILRNIGEMKDEEVIEIFITGNETAKYHEIEKIFNDLKSYVRNKGMKNCKFLFRDDPNQIHKFNVNINFTVSANVKCNSLDTDSIKYFISNVASIKDQTLEYEKEVADE